MKKQEGMRVFRRGGWKMALCALLFVALIAVNTFFASTGVRLHADVSGSGLYTLSPITVSLLEGLSGDVEILLVTEDGSAPNARLTELLDRYEAASPRISTRCITAAESLYYSATQLTAGNIVVTNGEYDVILDDSDIYSVQYDRSGYYLTEYDLIAQNSINAAIANISTDLPVAYMLSGHGETKAESGLEGVFSAQNTHVKTLYLSELNAVPQDCALIVVNVPQVDISEKEAQLLIEWLDNGGEMLLVTDYAYGKMSVLASVCEHVGMSMIPGVVVEGDAGHMYGSDYAYYLRPDYCTDSAIDLSDMAQPALMAVAHAIDCTDANGYHARPLLETSDSAFVKPNAYLDGVTYYVDGDETGVFAVAAVSQKEDGGKVFWLGASQCLSDTIDAMTSGANYALIGRVVEWMRGEQAVQLVETVPGASMLKPGVLMTQSSLVLFVAVCVGVPVALFIFGAIMSIKRHRKAVFIETKE